MKLSRKSETENGNPLGKRNGTGSKSRSHRPHVVLSESERCKRPEAPTRATGIVVVGVATGICFSGTLRTPAVIIACSKMF